MKNVRAPGGKQNVLGTAEGDCGTGKVELSDGEQTSLCVAEMRKTDANRGETKGLSWTFEVSWTETARAQKE
jgi:hypothetical protein